MLSKGDLVKMRITFGGDSDGVKEMLILGKMMNYSDEEETYIIEPKAISIRKDQVLETERLLDDFDFENASEEMSATGDERVREIAPEIVNIRISNNNH